MNPIFEALRRECILAAEHIGLGITSFGKASYAHEAYYYNAFFSLCIGFERALKLILIFDYALEHNGNMPPNETIRQFGHSIDDLFSSVNRISNKYIIAENVFIRNTVKANILEVLNVFSNNTNRYYNIDFATDRVSRGAIEPIKYFFEKVIIEVAKLHYTQDQRELDAFKAQYFERIMGEYSFVLHHSESGDAISSIATASLNDSFIERMKPWTRMYILQIARFLAYVFSGLEDQTYQLHIETLPLASEIFSVFRQRDIDFKRKTKWTIY